MNEKEIFKILSSDDMKSKKVLLYKFFFFNYMLSITLQDITSYINEEGSKDEALRELPEKLYRCFILMLENLKDKSISRQLDLLMLNR